MKRRDFISLSGMGVAGAALPISEWQRGSHQEDPRFREISRLIEAKMAEYRVPGVAFGLLKDGSLSMGGFGLTNLDNPQPITAYTVFPLASIGKTITTVAMLRLVEQGRLDLRAPVREYLPDFRVRDEETSREVTPWHLLTHSPGWPGQLPVANRGDQTSAYFTESLTDLPQVAPRGEVWSYNNAAFMVAGRIVEVLTGSVLHDAWRALVFDPIGLDLAFSRIEHAMSHRFAVPHAEVGGQTAVLRPFQLPSGADGAGSIYMSLSALMAYARFHLGDGTASTGEPVLSRASLELMRTPQLVKKPTTDEMGVGWHLRRLNGVATAVHCGTLTGHKLHLQLVPERNLAFALLTNHVEGWRLNTDVEQAILDVYEGLALAPNQRTGGNRGGNERMTDHAEPLATQPALDEYVGTYETPPLLGIAVVKDGDRLNLLSGQGGSNSAPLVFWGPDLAYADPAIDDAFAYRGLPVEFIRDASGQIRWCRRGGRISLKV